MAIENDWGDSLSIKQVADLYGITVATLYYYEQINLFVARRNNDNGYRCYSGEDFAHLNLIRTLHEMDIDLSEIREFESSHNLSQSIEVLRHELESIGQQIDALRSRQSAVQSALMRYARILANVQDETITLSSLPARKCVTVTENLTSSDSIPLICAKRMRELGHTLNVFQMLPLFTITTETNELGTFDGKKLMLYSELPAGIEDDELPAGTYLSVTFRGSLTRTPKIYTYIQEFMNEHGLMPLGDPLEFWDINEYSTSIESEFVHTLQQQVCTK